jgi:transcriptional antiterminator RfaH
MSSEDSLRWYALYTKPRQEKRATENLVAWGIEALFPRLAGGSSILPVPFFPQYIFARFDLYRMLRKVHFTRGISHVVSFGGVPAAVPDEIIGTLRCRADKDMIIRRELTLAPGDTVVIQRGPLQNFVGVFEKELPGAERVRILLLSVAYTARAVVPRDAVTKLSLAS